MRLPFFKPWESAIAVLHDNILGLDMERQGKSYEELQADFGAVSQPLVLEPEKTTRESRFLLSLPVHHRIKNSLYISPWRKTKSIDISQNGVRLAIDNPLAVGTQIEIDMKLPHYKKTIRLNGVVVWAKRAFNHGAGYECGVAFESFRKKDSLKSKMTQFMADKLCSLALHEGKSMTCRPASSKEDLLAAYRLVYEEYQKRKICKEHASKLSYNFFCLMPDSRTFLLEQEGRLLGTLSLLVDAPCGLPMEEIFPDRIGAFRIEGKRAAEVSLLALDSNFFGRKSYSLTDLRKLTASFKLFKMMFDYARTVARITDLFIAMHPKHQDLYRYLTFETIGPVREGREKGKMVIPMRMDIIQNLASLPRELSIQKYFIEETIPRDLLETHFEWNTESAREFLFYHRDIWSELLPHEQAYLKTIFPRLA